MFKTIIFSILNGVVLKQLLILISYWPFETPKSDYNDEWRLGKVLEVKIISSFFCKKNFLRLIFFLKLKLTEEKAKNETKEAIIKELNLQIELKNSEIETLNAQIVSQQTKITDLENDCTNFANTSSKSQQTITSLEEANHQLSLKIVELESLAE